jgi:hypothetical protein
VLLHPGDRLEIVGIPDLQVHLTGGDGSASQRGENKRSGVMPELAPVDYLEFGPASPITPQ